MRDVLGHRCDLQRLAGSCVELVCAVRARPRFTLTPSPGPCRGRGPAPASGKDILDRQVVLSKQAARPEPSTYRGETIAAASMAPRGREDAALADLCADDAEEAALARDLARCASRSSRPPHFETRMLNASQAPCSARRYGLLDRAQRLVDDDRLTRASAVSRAQTVEVVRGQRLLDGADPEGAHALDRRQRLVGVPGAVGVDAEVGIRPEHAPEEIAASRSSRSRSLADLDLDLPDAERPDRRAPEPDSLRGDENGSTAS